MDKHSDQPKPSPKPDEASLIQIERRRRELWTYLAVSIAAIEMLIVVGALCYGFLMGYAKGSNGQLQFPWLAWVASSISVPAVVLLAVHFAGVGLFRSSIKSDDSEWLQHLPEKLQKTYRIIARAPAVVLLGGLITLGAVLLTLDGALNVVESFLTLFQPYILHILAGIAALLVIFGLAAVWLNYRSRRLFAEYEYHTEVLRQTGLVIVDKNSRVLQPGEMLPGGYAMLEAAPASSLPNKALPEGDIVDVEEVTDADGKPGYSMKAPSDKHS